MKFSDMKPKEKPVVEEEKEVEVPKKTRPKKRATGGKSKSSFIVIIILVLLLVVWFSFKDRGRVLYLGSNNGSFEEIVLSKDRTEVYTKYSQNFSLELPIGFKLDHMDSDDMAVYLFRGEDENKAFQVLVEPFVGVDRTITSSYILEKIPGARVESIDQKEVGDNIQTLSFWAEDKKNGVTREVWMLKEGILYQITTYDSFDAELAEIFSTWRFDN